MIALRRTPSLLLVLAVLAACGTTPEARFYVLEPLAPPAAGMDAPATGAPGTVLLVSPVELPQGLDRPQMITRVGPNEVAMHEYDRWAEPLGQGIARVLAENLGTLLGSEHVTLLPGPAVVDAHASRLGVAILRFEGGPESQCTLVARWSLQSDKPGAPALVRRSELTVGMPSRDGAGFAAAMSRNLESLAREIAAAVGAKP